MLTYLNNKIKKKKEKYNTSQTNVVPDSHKIPRNHHLLAVYIEKKVEEELLEHG